MHDYALFHAGGYELPSDTDEYQVVGLGRRRSATDDVTSERRHRQLYETAHKVDVNTVLIDKNDMDTAMMATVNERCSACHYCIGSNGI
jgi:hypothetical protein